MLELGKPNTSFGGSESGSPLKKANTSFMGSFFKKKADNANANAQPAQDENQPAPQSPPPKAKARSKDLYKKNIADGRIKLNVAESDKVFSGSDYRENLHETLDQAPTRTTSYIENLKSRDFSQINNREVKRFIDAQKQQKENMPSLNIENLELELLELSKSYDTFLAKFFKFFQGILPGFCIIHLFLIFGSGDQTILNNYVLSALRINQIFYIVALLSTIGAFNRYIETRIQYNESIRSQPMLKDALSRQATKYLVASVCFFAVYAMNVFNHECVAKISDVVGTIIATNFTNLFGVFKALSAVMTALSVIGWCSLILTNEELNGAQIETFDYGNLTGDESSEDLA